MDQNDKRLQNYIIVPKYVVFLALFQDESFLEDINMILNTGDIANLYENEERLEIIEKVQIWNLI